MASEGRLSTESLPPAALISMNAKYVPPLSSVMTTRRTLALRPPMMLRIKSCVIGLGGAAFPSAMRIACASAGPIHIGKRAPLAFSSSSTTGWPLL